GATSAFPNQSVSDQNYGVDVVFTSVSGTSTPTSTRTGTLPSTATPTSTVVATATSSSAATTPAPTSAPGCPCSAYSAGWTPQTTNSMSPTELGTKLRSDVGGQITAVRFYKAPGE